MGDGTNISRSLPVMVSGLSHGIQISGGGYHSLAIGKWKQFFEKVDLNFILFQIKVLLFLITDRKLYKEGNTTT